jgi:hypothetical protein
MTNLTLTIHFCDISQSFVSATKYENTSTTIMIFFLIVLFCPLYDHLLIFIITVIVYNR